MTDGNNYREFRDRTGNMARCPPCPFGVMDRPATVGGLRRPKSADNFGVLPVHPLASLMCTRARACKRIVVGGRTRRTKNETADSGCFRTRTVVELSIGENPGGRTRRTKHGWC